MPAPPDRRRPTTGWQARALGPRAAGLAALALTLAACGSTAESGKGEQESKPSTAAAPAATEPGSNTVTSAPSGTTTHPGETHQRR